MNRNEKLAKLARATREWRGAWDATNEKWIRPPQPKAVQRVAKWIVQLGLELTSTLQTLAGFKSYKEFDAWLARQ